MKDYKIPNDVKKYAFDMRKKILTKWLIFTAVVALAIVLINTRADQLSFKSIPIHITGILLVLPFFITKAYRLFEQTYSGVIENVDLSYVLKYDSNGGTRFNFSEKTNVEKLILTIRLKNGREKKVLAAERIIDSSHNRGRSEPSSLIEHYAVGDTVIHVAGTKFLQALDKEKTVCVVCGNLENSASEQCSECGHTIKIEKGVKIY